MIGIPCDATEEEVFDDPVTTACLLESIYEYAWIGVHDVWLARQLPSYIIHT